jgi:hypothetical protein
MSRWKVQFNRLTRSGWFWLGLAALIALHLYFVQELIAAELLFALLFVLGLVIYLAIYAVSRAGDSGIRLAESGVRRAAPFVRRVFREAEPLSKRPFRRPHSTSVR